MKKKADRKKAVDRDRKRLRAILSFIFRLALSCFTCGQTSPRYVQTCVTRKGPCDGHAATLRLCGKN